MNPLRHRVDIKRNGAILIGENFVIDGHHERPFRVITHFHADHVRDLKLSLNSSNGIISTPATMDALAVLGYEVPPQKRIQLDYGAKVQIQGETMSLERAKHVLGSSQVLIESQDGLKIGYTGDFKSPGRGTVVLKPDILVIDATYGSPEHVRSFKDEVEMLLRDYVADSLMNGPVTIYSYHGKTQEVMELFRKCKIDAPFIAKGRVYQLSKVAARYGYQIGEIHLKGSETASEIEREGWYVEFRHFNEFWSDRSQVGTSFLLSGWEFKEPIYKIGDRTYKVAFSDHADFEEIIEYITASAPQLVVIDGSRGGSSAGELASWIKKNLKISALVMP